jgi:hypothetical protein
MRRVLCAAAMLLALTYCGEDTLPTAPDVATPTPTPAPYCEVSTAALWNGYEPPLPGEVMPEWQDHRWVYFRAQLIDARGHTLDPLCDWDRYLHWPRVSGDADCRLYGNENGPTASFYCFSVGDVAVAVEAAKDGQNVKALGHYLVRPQPEN